MLRFIREKILRSNTLPKLLGADLRQRLASIEKHVNQNRLQAGKLQAMLAKQFCMDIHHSEFQVYSQFGEDGIIQFLIRNTEPIKKLFVEFGVERYTEANTRFLLENDNWSGLIIDGNSESIDFIRSQDYYWRHDLTAVSSFITKDNINSIISENGFAGDVGILSVDIDGNDFWVWQAINVIKPTVVIAEYNSTYGPKHAVSVPYQENFVRTKAHYSNLYWGCSLSALYHLGLERGYDLVACNSAGNNAFFVMRGTSHLKSLTPQQAFVESKFRESRDQKGRLTFLSGHKRLNAIREMPLIDVVSGKKISCGDLIP